ncbi:S41 family peptidase [Nocardia sp. NPDC088792]|uniref:S41 family peptidase n=1 Tax=Nocardia sp. NPDC088792 TaxID=3364332 RepID=UPI0038161EC5
MVIDGVWQTDGYSTIMVVDAHGLHTYDRTTVSCLPGLFEATTKTGTDETRTFDGNDGTVSTITLTRDPNTAEWRIDANEGARHLHRLPEKPSDCVDSGGTPPIDKDPQRTFDVFWHTLDENYPFFAAHDVNWHQTYTRYRPMVTATTSDDDLAKILGEMIAPLQDAHLAIMANGRPIGTPRPGTRPPTPQYIDKALDLVRQTDPNSPMTMWANNHIGYADLPDHIGYLWISGFSDYTDSESGSYAANAAELDRALTSIFTPARTTGPNRLTGLIIDTRINGGGDDPLGLAIAARLTDHPFFAYAKETRNNPCNPDRFTLPQPITVQPYGSNPYLGKIAILTSESTISAGETFTQALLQRSPRPTILGENTQGVFSDVMTRRLPNGWTFILPNEKYLTPAGTTYDVTGIPADVPMPVFPDEDFSRGVDSARARAVEVLRR